MAATVKKIGRYDVLSELGHGAMGVVYKAVDPLIGRTVAIKTIRFGTPEAGDDREQLVQRLHREAQAAGVLSHSGIVTVFDIGEQADEAYIVMEFVDGKSLEDILASAEPLPPGMFLSVLRGTAVAIDFAHSKGIIHRDIKPSNIMICSDGTVKIADFGIAKLTASNSLTRSGFVVGTPSYMSPEQAQGRAVDGRSDQFSLAVLAFRMLTGRLPFEGETLTALLTKILWDEPEYESARMNPAIRPVFKRALSKDPQLRFPTCSDFVRGLEEALVASDPSMLAALSSMPQAPSSFNASFAGSTPAGGMSLDASRSGQETVPQAAGWTTPFRQTQAMQDKGTGLQPPSGRLEGAAKSGKKKWMYIAAAAALGCIALVWIVLFAFKEDHKTGISARNENAAAAPSPDERAKAVMPAPEPSSPVANPEGSTISPPSSRVEPDSVRNAAPSVPALRSEGKKTSADAGARQKPPTKAVAPRAVPVQPEPGKGQPLEAAAPVQKQAEEATVPPQADSGVLTWSGELERNSILVITEQRSSVGNVVGQFPGKPIRISVEPKGLTVRQLPSEANRWSQVILYSGNQRYSSISIHWSIIE